ncbi:SulP family inorganic anion transporter [Catellatospora vulcania]|uniref:SulP family inorganic anion transporter n=1 Tax=Catellatospora vulcania TaxID=1460450 RepID=UPI0012D3827A|nr:SulP family inorganic anion transporter [Catellatospora vulcania]
MLSRWRQYRPEWLRPDTIAGLTVWAVLVPECLAYATIAGVPPVIGLYAAAPALVLYAIFGSSRHLVVGPMAATAALSASVVAVYAGPGERFVAMTTALALVVGVLALIAGLARLGFLASFISEPVLKGFIVGLALTIIAGQLPKLFGVPKGEGNFFAQLWHFLTHLGQTNPWTLAIGAVCLAVVIGLKELKPVVPGSLVAVALGILAVAVLHLDRRGVAIVGHIDPGLPALGLPGIAAADWLKLVGPAVGVALIGFAEGLGAAKTYAARFGYTVDANRELIGLGTANMGAGLASGMVVNGSLSKTAVNAGAGARSQLSGLVVAVLTVVTLLFLTGLFEQLPEAALAAVVIAALVELVDIRGLRRLWRVSTAPRGTPASLITRPDFVAAIAALLGVLVFDTLPGLVIGMAVSLVLLLYRASRPIVAMLGRTGDGRWVDRSRHDDARPAPGVVVLRPEGAVFFANADHVRDRVRAAAAAPGTRAVVLDGESVPLVDVTAATTLSDLVDDLRGQGVELYVAHDLGQVRDILRRAGVTLPHVYATIDDAVRAATSTPAP